MAGEDFPKLIELGNRLSYKRTGRPFKNTEKIILEQILIGKQYEHIKCKKEDSDDEYSNGYIQQNLIRKLWNHLTKVFGKRIRQENVLDEFKRLQKPKLRFPLWIRLIVNKHTKLENNTVVSRSILGKTEEICCPNCDDISQNSADLNTCSVCSTQLALNGQQFNTSFDAGKQKFEDDTAKHTQAELHRFYQIFAANNPEKTNSTYGWHIHMRLMRTGLALLIALGICSTWYGFYWLANWYGAKNHLAGNLPQAQAAYNWALKINPLDLWSAEAHYNLGGVYEDQQNYQQAHAEYQRAIELGLVAAYNNQARLYILNGNYSAAVALLQVSIPLTKNKEPQDRANFFKNLGWARLEQGRLEEAEIELEQAIALQGDSAASYCLLAQVLERRGKNKQAVSQWENCLAYTHLPRTPEEDKWIRLGQQKLKAAYGDIK